MPEQPDAGTAIAALAELRKQLQAAIDGEHEADSAELANDLLRVYNDALWCRDAALAVVRGRGTREWRKISQATGVPMQTLQSRWMTWRTRNWDA